MKTLVSTHKILTTCAIASLFVLINFSTAQPGPQAGQSSVFASAGGQPTRNAPGNADKEKNNAVTEMFNNARYWVDYLRASISIEKDEASMEIESSPEVRAMESIPDYWPKTLKTTIEMEESNDNSNMDTDPEYWMHYLQETIANENTNS